MTEARTYHGGASPHAVLGEADIDKVIEATFRLLGEVGVQFDAKSLRSL